MPKKIFIFFSFIFLLCQNNIAYAKTIPVKLTPQTLITTSKGSKIQEGDSLSLVSAEDVYANSKLIIKKGTTATGLITELKDNDFCSEPASIYAEQFKIKDVSGNTLNLNGVVAKSGRNHWMFNQILPFILTPIRGGEVFIFPNKDVFTLYMETGNE